MIIWGVNLALIIAGISKLIKDKFGWTDEQASLLTATLTALAVIFVAKVEELEMLWPLLGEWGPIVMSAIAAFLTILGYMPATMQALRATAKKLSL